MRRRKANLQRSLLSEQRVPVYLISGFLGAGKTTVLRGLLHYTKAQGLTAAVLMNEYGDVSIDGELLQGEGFGVTELSDGCICCTLSVDFVVTMQAVAARRPDVIYIETTGLANPLDLLEQLTSLSLLPVVRVAALIAVLDARGVVRQGTDLGYQVQQYTAMADLVVVNKTDLATEEQIASLVNEIYQRSAQAEIVLTKHGQLDFGKILTRSVAHPASALPHVHTPVHNQVATFTYSCPRAFDPTRFEAFLQALPDDVWRLKGFLHVDTNPQQWLLQYDGTYFTLDKVTLRPAPLDHLVFIGQRLDQAALIAALADCLLSDDRRPT
ncbi:MAG: GTP-binding protein [Deltaproteobacteria bacterium]|nr:GTP-binding protein [Deltaproteobacteria bacterium]